MNSKMDLKYEDLRDLLMDNEVTNFDPVAEAFKVCQSTPAPLFVFSCRHLHRRSPFAALAG